MQMRRSVLAGETGERRDRKSTRLNSSHLVISYAVFCLKKKKSRAATLVWSHLDAGRLQGEIIVHRGPHGGGKSSSVSVLDLSTPICSCFWVPRIGAQPS